MAPPAPDEDAGGEMLEEAKITIFKGHTPNFSQATFCIQDEDHTLGNALRWMLMKDPQVEFCGYSIPHPSEYKIHLRIQMYDNASSIDALFKALNNLEDVFETIDQAYTNSYNEGKFKIEEDKGISLEQAKRKLAAKEEEKRLAGSRT